MSSQTLLVTIPILLVMMTSLVSGGCSFKDQMESTQSSFQDLDQAKLAAKMALAHKGLDIEVLKKRQARYIHINVIKNFFFKQEPLKFQH